MFSAHKRGLLVFLILLNVLFINYLNAAEKANQNSNDDLSSNTKEKQIIGINEHVHIYPGNLIINAKIDTGANTTSLGADDLEIVNEDGVNFAVFSLNGVVHKHKVLKFVRIKQHNAPSQRRPVIKLKLTLSDVTQSVNVTLTDRSNFKFKMIVGANFLYDYFIVDVSLKNTSTPSKVVAP